MEIFLIVVGSILGAFQFWSKAENSPGIGAAYIMGAILYGGIFNLIYWIIFK